MSVRETPGGAFLGTSSNTLPIKVIQNFTIYKLISRQISRHGGIYLFIYLIIYTIYLYTPRVVEDPPLGASSR